MHSSPPAHRTLQNRFLQLDYFTEAGPRISGLIPAGTQQNLLASLNEVEWDTPYGSYHLYGGHRLWAAPEIAEITYFPELAEVHVEERSGAVRLWRQDHGAAEYERAIDVTLETDAPRLHLEHSLRNLSPKPLNAAPWSISVLPMGSRARIPHSTKSIDSGGFLPNWSIAFWSYDELNDPRLLQSNDSVELRSDPQREPFKIGVYTTRGWAAAQIGEWMLVKHFEVHAPNGNLDFGANVEAYTNQRFLEFELIGEMRNLQQGESVNLLETWDVWHGSMDELDENGRLPDESH